MKWRRVPVDAQAAGLVCKTAVALVTMGGRATRAQSGAAAVMIRGTSAVASLTGRASAMDNVVAAVVGVELRASAPRVRARPRAELVGSASSILSPALHVALAHRLSRDSRARLLSVRRAALVMGCVCSRPMLGLVPVCALPAGAAMTAPRSDAECASNPLSLTSSCMPRR